MEGRHSLRLFYSVLSESGGRWGSAAIIAHKTPTHWTWGVCLHLTLWPWTDHFSLALKSLNSGAMLTTMTAYGAQELLPDEVIGKTYCLHRLTGDGFQSLCACPAWDLFLCPCCLSNLCVLTFSCFLHCPPPFVPQSPDPLGQDLDIHILGDRYWSQCWQNWPPQSSITLMPKTYWPF